jgi:hypothetical protein
MATKPSTARIGGAPTGVFARRRKTPDVRDHVRDPAWRVVIGLRGAASWLDERLDEAHERLVAFDEVRGQRGPVVHLDVDVQVVVAVPWGLVFGRPEALQVGWQRTGTGAAAQQIAAVGEVEREEVGVGDAVREVAQALGGGDGAAFVAAEVELRGPAGGWSRRGAVEIGVRSRHLRGDHFSRVDAPRHQTAMRIVVHGQIGCGGDENACFGNAAELQRGAVSRNCAAVGNAAR